MAYNFLTQQQVKDLRLIAKVYRKKQKLKKQLLVQTVFLELIHAPNEGKKSCN